MSPRRTLGVALVAMLPFAAACGAGQNNATESERATPYVPQVRTGDLLVTNVTLVPSGSTTTIGQSGSAGASPSSAGSGGEGYLLVTIANTGNRSDQLTGVSMSNGQVQPSGGSAASLQLKPRSIVNFGDPELGSSGTALQVSNVSPPVNVGGSLRVTFTFANARPATLAVLVKSPEQLGTTSTAAPLNLTGTYPTPTESASSGP